MLRSTRRGLETWHGRDRVTLADERARQQGTQTSTYTGAPVLDPTDERGQETACCHMAQATAPVLDSTLDLHAPPFVIKDVMACARSASATSCAP
jgi:hypothetical protein